MLDPKKLKLSQLKAELEARGLPTDGLRDTLARSLEIALNRLFHQNRFLGQCQGINCLAPRIRRCRKNREINLRVCGNFCD